MAMSGILAVTALAAAGAVGIRRLVRARRGSEAAAAAAGPPGAGIPPVTADSADRSVTCVDNGGTPFVVRLSYKRRVATVYLVQWQDDKKDDTSVVFRSFRYRRSFVGLDPKELRPEEDDKPRKGRGRAAANSTAAQEAPPLRRWWHGGNSVLLDLGGRRYLFIGFLIYEFTAYDDIQEYVSTMGNSAIPYPYAVGTKNTYLMIEDTYIPNHIIKLQGAEHDGDPYSVLYRADIRRWLPGVDPKRPGCPAGHPMQLWKESFQLQDFKLVHDRR